MELKSLYREIVNEHNLHPTHKGDMESPSMILTGVNPSCGDDIYLQLKLDENDIVTDGCFNGSGCAISQASADMMLDLVIGKSVEEAKRYHEIFLKMIRGTITDEELDELEDAQALKDIAHMPARVKCATLSWRTLGEILKQAEE